MGMVEEKINELEAMVAHQDVQIQDLSEIVTKQWSEIEALKRQLNHTFDKIKSMEDSIGQGSSAKSVSEMAASEKPPHY